ncbi:MOSC N-terminal beta barrel domain-containing protein [Agrobacterium tumefaciens]|uniref:MOSC N-terminal beta barrel domain-containing protein n=1 Tax=Agrobacterium tumefaciens TaxID=358 RepID=UPI000976DDC9|nr:hypothetical protein BV900_28185 [Agrobacterium tumefaciens]
MPARIKSLHIYPLKSGAVVDLWTARVENEGLTHDRRMMVTDQDGNCLTSRRFPKLMQLQSTVDGEEVVLWAAGGGACAFRKDMLVPAAFATADIWGEKVVVLDGGEAVAAWLSAFLDHPCRLAVKGPQTSRPLLVGQDGFVSFADTAPVLLTNEASLADLNCYMETPVEMARFRPNIVIEGALPFDEDGWGTIVIGGVEFEVAGPCDRCVVTTLEPGSGEARTDHEPLATLSRRRRGEDGKPYFGQFLIPRSGGRIVTGESVSILSRKTPVALRPATGKPVRAASTGEGFPGARAAVKRTGPAALVCCGIVRETHDVATFRFRFEDGGGLDYRPGQFITLLLDIDGAVVRRNYTISSSPSRPHHISVTVKRVADGRVSNWLHDTMKVEDRIGAIGPNGSFHLDMAGAATKLLMLSAGSGITPMIAMLRYITDHDLDIDVHFHHSARRYEDIAFRNELLSLQSQMAGRLHLSWNLTGGLAEDKTDLRLVQGRLDAAMLADVCPDIAERVAMCCGPSGFRESARAIHTELSPPGAVFLEESFGADVGALPVVGDADYHVTFGRPGGSSDVVTEGKGSATLLELARQNDVAINADCEAGICGACRCRIVSGEWVLAANCADPERSVLDDDEKLRGMVLACTTRPLGAVVVDL